MKIQSQPKALSTLKTMRAVYIWLRVALSYCVVGAVLTSLVSAYTQEVHLILISVIMAIFLAIGVYQAEIIRRRTGLNHYLDKLSQQKHQQF